MAGYPGTPGAPKPQAQVCIVVPSDAVPGETELTVHIPPPGGEIKEHACLKVKVPSQISPGKTLVLTKLRDNWSIGLPTFDLPDIITVSIPEDAVPGVTHMPIIYKGLEVTKVPVPARAKPCVDELRVDRPSDPSQPWTVILCMDPDYPDLVSEMAIGAAQSALRAPPLDENIAYQRLVEAVAEAGGYTNPKITRGRAPPLNIPGMVASEDIEKGEIICKIPKGLHFSPFTAQAYVPELWSSIKPPDCGRRSEEAAMFALGAKLLHEAEERAVARQKNPEVDLPTQSEWVKGADAQTRKVWEKYMDQLLAEDFTNHPMRKIGEDRKAFKQFLQPSWMGTHMYKEAKCMHTLYRIVAAASGELLGGPSFKSGMFLRAMLNFQSRQFKAAVSRSLVPIADLINHAPAIDQSVAWGWNEEQQAHILTCVRSVKSGQELLQSYGMHPNASFYRCYNFTMPPEKETAWCFSMWKDDIPAIFAQQVPVDSTSNTSEVHLHSGEVNSSLRDVMRDVAQNGGNPAFFLRVACMKCIQPYEDSESLRLVLDALKTSRADDPRSNDYWTHARSADKALADSDVVRIQMCEYLCLKAHLEAIDVISGELSEERCLFHADVMRSQLRNYVIELYEKHHFK